MKLIAVSSYGVGAIFIKIFTFSKWNHVAVSFDDVVIDSVGWKGVRRTHIRNYLEKYPNHEIIEVPLPNEYDAQCFALEQLGKPYDATALFGIVFQNRRWHNPDKWFCSELVEAIFIAGGKRRFRSDVISILPRETYAVN